MSKRRSKNSLRKEADRLFQKALLWTRPRCVVCNKLAQVIHHFIPKSLSNYLRYDLENGVPLCHSCHFRLHKTSDPQMILKIKEKLGEMWWERLQSLRRKVIKPNREFYEKAIEELGKNTVISYD